MGELRKPSLTEIEAYAIRHGLQRLTPADLERLADLAGYVSELGRALSRPPEKSTAPLAPFGRDGGADHLGDSKGR